MKEKLLESEVLKIVQKELSLRGYILWRNNVGALFDKNNRLIRYGLGNDSKKNNDYYKSSDLIGIKKVVITQDMVGKTIGQFVSIECKKQGWKYKATPHEVAQKRWIDLVKENGGESFFTGFF